MLRVHSPPGHHGAAASSASTTVQCAVSPQKVNSPRSRSPRKAQGAVIDLDDTDHGLLADGLLPFSVCRAVTKVIWTAARSQAEVAHASRSGDSACGMTFPLSLGCSEPSQTQSDESVLATAVEHGTTGPEDVVTQALAALSASACLTRPRPAAARGKPSPAEDVILSRVRTLSLCAVAYWREVSQDLGKAASSLARFLEMQRRLYWRRPPWRGVNLGGWLLLEPGPSFELFQQFANQRGQTARCEWQLLQHMRSKLGQQKTAEVLEAHRNTFLTEEDFHQIRSKGFNSVRIPFGYWVVTGPSHGDPYLGPALEFLDRALTWCKNAHLQVLLDLHGAPGGESGETPCGREWKDWRWEQWRFEESLQALKIVARRYRGHPAVSGIAVCNEPSEKVPADVLCQFYEQAIQAIRSCGMGPEDVSIVLPVYRTERLDEIWRLWNKTFDGFARHANVAFDLHLYHCFGAWWQRQGLNSHLRMTKRDRKLLRRVPAVVGEWSCALPHRAIAQSDDEDQAYQAFATAQLQAYSHASHGWFFWNWRDSPQHHPGWDAQTCLQRRWLINDWKNGHSGNVAENEAHPA